MKEIYMCPQAELMYFAPAKPIASTEPSYGWEDEVFSNPEPKYWSGDLVNDK